MDWKSINTAPKDGTIILACGNYKNQEVGEEIYGFPMHPFSVRWEIYHPNAPGKGIWRDKNGHKMNFLTHWIEMPKAPESK